MQYLEEHYYHIFNRGAYRKKIFFDEENFRFLFSSDKEVYREVFCLVDIILSHAQSLSSSSKIESGREYWAMSSFNFYFIYTSDE